MLNKVEIDKSLPTISISTVLTMLQEPFDQKGVAEKTYNKNFNNPESQYYQKSIDEIIDMWQEKGRISCHYGSLLDDYIGINLTKTEDDLELWKLDNNFDDDERLKNHCKAFDDFYTLTKASGDTEFIDREKTLYLRVGDMYVKGRFDALFRNKRTGKWIVVDWKSSGEIEKEKTRWTKNLLGAASKYPALNWYTYTMQLFFYKKALVDSGYLPEGTTYDDVDVMIVNLPEKMVTETQSYATHRAAMQFNSEEMEKIYNFAIKKHNLLNKKV